MATQANIINFALRRLGCEPIVLITDDNKRAKVMNDLYEIARQEALIVFRGGFSTVRAALTANANTPAFGYEHEVDLPAGYLQAISEYNESEFKREGEVLLTDATSLSLIYTQDITDETKFTPNFAKVFSLTLAKEGCHSLTQDKGLKKEIENELELLLGEAMFNDAKESTAEEFVINDFTGSRL